MIVGIHQEYTKIFATRDPNEFNQNGPKHHINVSPKSKFTSVLDFVYNGEVNYIIAISAAVYQYNKNI